MCSMGWNWPFIGRIVNIYSTSIPVCIRGSCRHWLALFLFFQTLDLTLCLRTCSVCQELFQMQILISDKLVARLVLWQIRLHQCLQETVLNSSLNLNLFWNSALPHGLLLLTLRVHLREIKSVNDSWDEPILIYFLLRPICWCITNIFCTLFIRGFWVVLFFKNRSNVVLLQCLRKWFPASIGRTIEHFLDWFVLWLLKDSCLVALDLRHLVSSTFHLRFKSIWHIHTANLRAITILLHPFTFVIAESILPILVEYLRLINRVPNSLGWSFIVHCLSTEHGHLCSGLGIWTKWSSCISSWYWIFVGLHRWFWVHCFASNMPRWCPGTSCASSSLWWFTKWRLRNEIRLQIIKVSQK